MHARNMSLAGEFREAGPEADLLLSMLCLRYNPAGLSRIVDLLDKGICWKRFVTLALRNEVLPTISPILKDHCADALPSEMLAFVDDRFHRNVQRNAVLCQELLNLNEQFRMHDIRIINYKGPETAHRIGLEIDCCQFNDLDFLVRKEQEAILKEVLLSLGYRLSEERKSKGQIKDFTYIRERNHDGSASIAALPGDIYETGRIIVEPHLQITEYRLPIAIEKESLWEAVEFMEFMGKPLPVFAKDDLLLVLCIAGCKASWKNLKLINHIAALLNTLPDSVVDRCIDKAKIAGCERMVQMGLLLANGLFLTEKNPDRMARARLDEGLMKCAREVVIARSRNISSIDYHPFPWRYSSVIMQTLDRPSDRIRYLWRTTTVPYPVHYKRFPLPGFLHNLYRFIVPFHDYVLVPAGQWYKWRFRPSGSGAFEVHRALQDFLNRRRTKVAKAEAG